MERLIIFYDSLCPLCAIEMKHLKQADKLSSIKLIDLHQDQFEDLYPDIDKNKAMDILHGQLIENDQSTQLLLGLDVTHKAWSLVGCGWRTGFLRWPIVKPIADTCYRFFARHRYTISRMLTGKARLSAQCDSQRCNKQGHPS